jgi:hypothetical protein
MLQALALTIGVLEPATTGARDCIHEGGPPRDFDMPQPYRSQRKEIDDVQSTKTSVHGGVQGCGCEDNGYASHSGANGGVTKRWFFGNIAIACRSSSSSFTASASRLDLSLSRR